MMAWLQRFTPREQLSLLVMAIAVLLYMFYMLVWSPLAGARDDLQSRNRATAEVLQRVDLMVAQILDLRAAGATVAGAQRNLTAIVNASTREFSLPVSRLQPGASGSIQVRLEGASFDDLMRWLHRLEIGEGLLVSDVAITQAGAAGRVNATVRLAQEV